MDEHGVILDYASPRPRGRLRLPARSDLLMTLDPDGLAVTVVESLKGRGQAYWALAFGAFTTLVSVANANWAWRIALRRDTSGAWIAAAVSTAVLLALPVVMTLVANETWRRTILRAGRDGLTLRFRSLMKRVSYEWPADAVRGLRVVATQDAPDAAPLGEIQIDLIDRPLVKLFTDHLRPKLDALATVVRQALDPDAAGAPGAIPPAGVAVPGAAPEPDRQTFDRLRAVHRELRERL